MPFDRADNKHFKFETLISIAETNENIFSVYFPAKSNRESERESVASSLIDF